MSLSTKEHLSKHDREIAAIRKLILTGMKMLNQFQRENYDFRREMRAELRQLAASQRQTDRQLQALMRSLERGSNGHQRRPIG